MPAESIAPSLDWSTVRHFRRAEWRHDPDRVCPELVRLLDEVRDAAGVPVIIHCAWAEGGHAPKSYHYRGLAVDFHFGAARDGYLTHTSEYVLLAAFRDIGGLGFYPQWAPRPGWHVDLRPPSPAGARLEWTCVDNRYTYGPGTILRALHLLT